VKENICRSTHLDTNATWCVILTHLDTNATWCVVLTHLDTNATWCVVWCLVPLTQKSTSLPHVTVESCWPTTGSHDDTFWTWKITEHFLYIKSEQLKRIAQYCLKLCSDGGIPTFYLQFSVKYFLFKCPIVKNFVRFIFTVIKSWWGARVKSSWKGSHMHVSFVSFCVLIF